MEYLSGYTGSNISPEYGCTSESQNDDAQLAKHSSGFASPWLSTRLDSIIYRVRRGDHLGLALRQCGYQFPSGEAANFLSLLQGDGATELISNYGQRWLSQTLQRVKKRANVIRLIMLIFLVMSLMLLVFAIMDIQSISDNSMGNF